jgi:hypothetical protein
MIVALEGFSCDGSQFAACSCKRMAKKSTLIFVFLAAVAIGLVLGFLCELAPWQRRSLATNDHPIIPITSGLVLLLIALSKLPEVKPVKPTLFILALSALTYGVLVVLLYDENFHIAVGHQTAAFLDRFRFMIGGIFIGAVLSSLFHGHWTSALLVARQRQQSSAAQKKMD